MKQWLYEVLESPQADNRTSRAVSAFLGMLILANVIAVILGSVQPLYGRYRVFFSVFEAGSVAIFTAEYLLRVWACTVDERYRASIFGRVRFVLTPMAIIDLAAILPFYVVFFSFDLRAIRMMRLFRVFRLFKFGRYSEAFRAVGSVIRGNRRELTATTTILAACLIVAATLMYEAERVAQPDDFGSVPAAMWWAIVTLTTVGYGDTAPVTNLGKFLGSVIAILGIGMVALPTGIIGAGFVEMINARKKQAEHCPHCGKSIATPR